jgi:hypothetical protein
LHLLVFAKQDFIAHPDTMMSVQERDALQVFIALKRPFPLWPVLQELSATQLDYLKPLSATHAQLAWFAMVLH